MSDKAFVDIVDVMPEAQRIPVHAMVIGDKIFDVFGRTYDTVDLKVNAAGMVWIKAMNDPGRWQPCARLHVDEVTVVPAFGARSC